MTDFSESGSSSKQKADVEMMPKVEPFTYDVASEENMYSRIMGDNVASSSGSNVRSSFTAMGFTPSLVDRAIKENGEDDVDLILETLFAYSALQSPNSEHSDSVDGLFEGNNKLPADCGARKALHRSGSSDSFDSLFSADEETCSHSNHNRDTSIKEEPDLHNVGSDKRASLVGMSFSKDEVESAMNKLGVDAPINDLVDFIFAARMSDKYEKVASDPAHNDAKNVQQCSTEALFGTMEKTLVLFEMGFSEQQISTAIEKYGSDVPISQLATSIVAEEDADTKLDQHFSVSSCADNSIAGNYCAIDPLLVKAEEYNLDGISVRNFDFLEKLKGKKPKEKNVDEPHCLKRLKEEYDQDLSSSVFPTWLETSQRNSTSLGSLQMQGPRKKVHRAMGTNTVMDKMPMPKSCKTHDKLVAEPPYFFYGSITNLTHDSWVKISQFLYSIQPEFVNTQSFSALSRPEGYVHNLPAENRFHVLPKPPMTIEEAFPQAKKWWPSWDTREQLSCISCESIGISETCERLGRILDNSKGVLSGSQQAEVLQQCQTSNLVWVGRNKLAPIEPEILERILGYPIHHTRSAGFSLQERLVSLKNCFQVDTLAFHLSALKALFPQGLRVLSICSGIGGAEIALHKLGIEFKVVVSVEACETKRRILKHWWEKEGISGELVQMESIRSRVATTKLEGLIDKYSGFDFVIGQNPPSTDNMGGVIDFQLFYEFVRAVQRVRSAMGKSR